ncbi:MAG: ribosome small subunit-dependent GTPase A [Planctomycetaceae bacterium]|jgi:ribosome biogenesis GTPase|nr:ribosome small subunit-dependent GTPase A [Planctomycetaceae bacterium]
MSKKKTSRKIRVAFRKNRAEKPRRTDWTRKFDEHGFEDVTPESEERISGKGELVKHRTVIGEVQNTEGVNHPGFEVLPDVDFTKCQAGRVLRVFGLNSDVESEDGKIYSCVTRRILKTLTTDQRHVVIAGDRVAFRVPEQHGSNRLEGIIERVEPRYGTLARSSRNRKHLLVANVDQAVIVTSANEPRLKPNFIDRVLVTAERAEILPVICINKIDRIDVAELQPLIGVYSQMGYKVILTSTITCFGIERLRKQLIGRQSVFAGQSGVGKSSLLNLLEPELNLRVGEISEENEKGKHTTTTAELLKLSFGGYVVDTPGIRQFMLWDIIPEEVSGFFRDIHPFENLCHYPNCTHTHEDRCAVKNGVADGRIDLRRYDSYLAIRESKDE